jgi:Fic family protein
LSFFLQGVTEQAADAVNRARELQHLHSQWRQDAISVSNSALLQRLIDHLFTSPIFTITSAQKSLGVTYRSIQKNVEKLVALSIVTPLSQQRGRAYVATAILDITGKS